MSHDRCNVLAILSTYAVCSSIKNSTRDLLVKYAYIDDFFAFEAKDQFERLQICFENALLQRGGGFSYVVKSRPDMVWLDDINTTFVPDAILLRSRRVGGMELTSQHVSAPLEKVCQCSNGCIMVDDQVAVVPALWQSAYFRLRKLVQNETTNNDSSSTSSHVQRRTDGQYRIRIDTDLISVCPCVMEKAVIWPEGVNA